MATIRVRYHETRFFFQWLKLRLKIYRIGLRVIAKELQKGRPVSRAMMKELLSWRGWKWYRRHGTYVLKIRGGWWLVNGSLLHEFFHTTVKNLYPNDKNQN